MPNGFHHRDELDVLTFAYTEQQYPEYRIRHTYEGIRLLHTGGHRGYAPTVEWERYVEPAHEGRAFSRASVEALATKYIASLKDALSNPADPLSPELRRASLAWFAFSPGWAIVIGDYHLYAREDGPLAHISRNPTFDEIPADIQENLIATSITVDGLFGDLSTCVYAIGAFRAIVCSTAPLHLDPEWPRFAELDIDEERAAGAMVGCMRSYARSRQRDTLVMRWRRPA